MKLLISILFSWLLCSGYQANSQTERPIKPGDNLLIKNIPDIPTSIADEVDRYTESRAASPVDWHPKKREMLMTTRFGNMNQLHFITQPGGARTQLTFYDEPVSSAVFEPVNGDYFIFSKDAGGNEFGQLYRYDVAEKKVTLITDGGRNQNGNIIFNNAKNLICFTSTKRNGTDRDIYTMDPKNPASVKLIHEVKGGGWSVLDWSPDDKKLLIREGLSVNDSKLYIFDMASGLTALTGPVSKKDLIANSTAKFSKDGAYYYFITDFENEFSRLARWNLKTNELKFITSDIKWDVTGFDLKKDGSEIIFSTNQAGISKVYLLETNDLIYRQIKALPDGQISSINWRPDSREFVFNYSSAKNNSDIYTHDLVTGKTDRWTESELGGMNADDITEPELIKWKSFDGLQISGFYYKPPIKFTGKRPVIINIHGGPEGQSLPGFQGRNNYFILEMGIAMIYPNVRGSTGFGKTYVKLDNCKLRENSVKDIGALIDWIATQPDLDASRIMITGGSYGGYMSLAVSTMYSDKIKCSVDVVGISNFNTFLKNTESYRRDLRRVEYGNEQDPDMAAFLETISPINNAAKIQKPLFIVQGGNDPRVPRTEAEQMFNSLNNSGKTVWYLEAKDEGHGFRKKNNVDFQFYSTVEFMRRYLLNEK